MHIIDINQFDMFKVKWYHSLLFSNPRIIRRYSRVIYLLWYRIYEDKQIE